METQSIAVPVSESSQVGHVRRLASGLASRLGMSQTEAGQAAIVATELAGNLVQHGGGGQLLLRPLATPEVTGMEIMALDQGNGMRSVVQCMEDGFSTAGTAGNGLGAVRRLSGVFDIFTHNGAGTAVLAQIWPNRAAPEPAGWQVGAVSAPKSGEDACGDAWDVLGTNRRAVFALADGLGHGTSASVAAQEAMRIVRAHVQSPPAEIVNYAHFALRSTRGAAMAVAVVDEDRAEIRFAGVGNIAAVLIDSGDPGEDKPRTRSMVSYNGTVGHELRKLQEFVYPWKPGSLLLMHTDGLGTQWLLDKYPGLLRHHASLIAGVLFRDYERGRDDVTVLVARNVKATAGG